MRLSVLLPTCNRPKILNTMLNSLRDTVQGWEVEIIVLIDGDLESSKIAIDYGCSVDYSDTKRNVLSLWNKGLKMCTGNMIHPAMDDLVYHKNWLEYGLSSHDEKLNGCGVVGFNDLAYDGNTQVATQFMFDRQYCKDYMGGVVAPPVYNYLWIDVEVNERAKMAGKFYWDKRAIVEHRHSAHGKRDYDNHDRLKDEMDWSVLDGRIYKERKKNGFPVTWSPLI